MTAKDSSDGLLGDIAAVVANAVNSFTTYLLDGCGLSHGGANLQGFGNYGDGAGYVSGSASTRATSECTTHAVSATTQNSRRPKEQKQSDGEEEGGH